jgi:predicted acyltransferase
VGVSTVFSLDRVRAAGGAPGAYRRILGRAALLFFAGVLFSGGLNRGFDQVRWMNVLQRIALCYAVTGLLYTKVRLRGLVATCALLLVGYWALLTFVPIRDISLERASIAALQASTGVADPHALYERTTTTVVGGYEDGKNLTHHLDFLLLPGRKYDGLYDPEGLLSTLPSIASCLFGLFAGMLLRRRDLPDMKKVQWLVLAGIAGVAAGWLWGLQFPVIKRIWTSSYALVAGGWSCLLLAGFFLVIDVWKQRRWAMPFVWMGMNAITIYLGRRFVDFDLFSERLVGGPKATLSPGGQVLIVATSTALTFLVAWYLHRRKLFFKI